ncbi:hypothetical protein [uncultured Endozoicomonas sp.]|uniref:hypothetical protein n=1 Tax=uncultured Endozoicomonas sp. TaxID=432652 RepID=UPI00262F687A|nr:hypothetical protein [uncultured Endozoicomonas sp.]
MDNNRAELRFLREKRIKVPSWLQDVFLIRESSLEWHLYDDPNMALQTIKKVCNKCSVYYQSQKGLYLQQLGHLEDAAWCYEYVKKHLQQISENRRGCHFRYHKRMALLMNSLANLESVPMWVFHKYGIRTHEELMHAACFHANRSKEKVSDVGKEGLEKATKTAEWFSGQLKLLARNEGYKTRKTKPVFSRF